MRRRILHLKNYITEYIQRHQFEVLDQETIKHHLMLMFPDLISDIHFQNPYTIDMYIQIINEPNSVLLDFNSKTELLLNKKLVDTFKFFR